jgi:hypothetical protein
MSSKINLKDVDKASKNDTGNPAIKLIHSKKDLKNETDGFKKFGN